MSVFSKLKNKVIGIKEREDEPDFETVRSAVLGDRYPPVNTKKMDIDQPSWKTKYQDANTYGENNAPKEVSLPSLESRDVEPPFSQSFGSRQQQEPEKPRFEKRDFYEVMDRLGVIEAQLAAIRSQTETINERLKMMEIRMQRRY